MPLPAVADRPQRWDQPFSDKMTDGDVARILKISPFSDIDESKFTSAVALDGILRNDARILNCQAGDIIIREGDWGNSAFFILSGAVHVEIEPPATSLPDAILGRRQNKPKTLFHAFAQLFNNHREPEFRDMSSRQLAGQVGTRGAGESMRIYLQDVGAVIDRFKTVRLEAPKFFGEIAALGRIPRQATVFAEGDVDLVEIRWQGLRDIMRKDDGIRNHIDHQFRSNALETFIRDVPMFQNATQDQIEKLLRETKLETYGNYDSAKPFKDLAKEGIDSGLVDEPIVAEEGHHPNGVILIRSGLARLSQKYHHGHRTVSYLTPGGQIYGFEEIAESARTGKMVPLQLSLRAIGYLTVCVVPTPLIEEHVLGIKPGQRLTTSGPASSDQTPTQKDNSESRDVDNNLLEFLVEQRYVQGTATMLIDMDRCTRCDDCVRACSTAHDSNPRFIRHGPMYGHYMVANACMHCADPVCLIECPTGAIHRERLGGQVVINDQTCIGCTQCANNCPYDAIRMVPIRDQIGNLIRDKKTQFPLIQATKCDLCIDQLGGPACARACPHDALVRIDMRDRTTIGDLLKK